MRPLQILTWHVHGNYLFYLSFIPHLIYLPVNAERNGDYAGKGAGFPWPDNVIEVPEGEVKNLDVDVVLFQRPGHYLTEQHRLFSEAQQRDLSKVYLEHDPPLQHPSNTLHWVRDPSVHVVHVTNYNRLMWDNGAASVHVIPHGVVTSAHSGYHGDIARGLVIVNHLHKRGRRMGADLFDEIRKDLPLTLVGMDSLAHGGTGEISHDRLNDFASHYRFVFNPARYSSLSLAVCEAMMVGIPVVGLATTELSTTIENNVSGFVGNDIDELKRNMKNLLSDRVFAARLGQGAKDYAERHFSIGRFVNDWHRLLSAVVRQEPRTIITETKK